MTGLPRDHNLGAHERKKSILRVLQNKTLLAKALPTTGLESTSKKGEAKI